MEDEKEVRKDKEREDTSDVKGDNSNQRSFPKRKELYEEGLSDQQIADEVGVIRWAIISWRFRRGLPANSDIKKVDYWKLLRLEGDGWGSRCERDLIKMFTALGDLIFDPFCGSGSVLMAAQKSGTRLDWRGKNPKYAEVVEERLNLHTRKIEEFCSEGLAPSGGGESGK